MKPHITWSRLENAEQLEELNAFAKTFDHILTEDDLTEPILIAKCGEEYIGYVQIVGDRLAFPAWSPNVYPTKTVRAIEELIAWSKFDAAIKGRPIVGFVARSKDSPFDEDAMNKLGFENVNMELWSVKK